MREMVVMGLDLSLTSTGLVVLAEGPMLNSKAIKSKENTERRLIDIKDQIEREMLEYEPNLVVLEGYAMLANGRITALAELGGVVKASLYVRKQPFIVVPPARVKKFATGKGNANKDEVRLWVYKRWGVELKTNDEIDAYVLAQIGLSYLGCPVQCKAQQEVIDDLLKAYPKRGDTCESAG
jgi:crossover junction endodeoxyribonuclease RuvC